MRVESTAGFFPPDALACLDRNTLLAEKEALLANQDRLKTSLNWTQARLQQVTQEKKQLWRRYNSLRELQIERKTSSWVETIQTISISLTTLTFYPNSFF